MVYTKFYCKDLVVSGGRKWQNLNSFIFEHEYLAANPRHCIEYIVFGGDVAHILLYIDTKLYLLRIGNGGLEYMCTWFRVLISQSGILYLKLKLNI